MLRQRLPQVADVVSVYSVIVLMLYSWAIIVYFWNLPPWLNFMPANELAAVLSYTLSATWLESVLVLTAVLTACLLLPASLLRDDFRIRGGAAAISILALLMLRSYLLGTERFGHLGQAQFGLALLVAAALGVWLAAAPGPVRRSMVWLADQSVVFLYVFMPISFLAVCNVILRNLT